MSVPADELARPITAVMREADTAIRVDQTVGEVVAGLRERSIDHRIFYLYATDADGRLVGVTPTRGLLLADPETPVSDVVTGPVESIPATATLADAVDALLAHRYLALPVVDDDGRLVGVVDVRTPELDLPHAAESRRLDELFHLFGVAVAQLREGGAIRGFRLRMPWLACNLVGGIACAAIAAFFDAVLAEVLVLAMFIPLVLTLAESISIQAMTLALQHLHRPGVDWRRIGQRLVKEWRTAGLLATACGALVALAASFWHPGGAAVAVIGASVLGSMLVAVTIGTAVPTVLHARRLDPQIAAGPLVLMLTDTATLAIYLGGAAAVLGGG